MRCSRGLCIFERCTLHINAISPCPKDGVLEGKKGTEIVEPLGKGARGKTRGKDRRHVHRDIFRAASSTVYQLHQSLFLFLSVLFFFFYHSPLSWMACAYVFIRVFIYKGRIRASLSLSLTSRRNGVSKDYKAREIFSGHGRHNSATAARFIPLWVSMRDLRGVCLSFSSKSRTTGFRSHNGPFAKYGCTFVARYAYAPPLDVSISGAVANPRWKTLPSTERTLRSLCVVWGASANRISRGISGGVRCRWPRKLVRAAARSVPVLWANDARQNGNFNEIYVPTWALFDSGLVDRTLRERDDREAIFLTAEDPRLDNIARVCDIVVPSAIRSRGNLRARDD